MTTFEAYQDTMQHSLYIVNQVSDILALKNKENLISLVNALVNEITSGTISWNKNVVNSIQLAIKLLDEKISEQLSEIIHADKFKRLEGAWRGLQYITYNTNTDSQLKIKVLNASKQEIYKDLSKSSDFDQSKLFKTIYEREFGTPGGEPFAILIGDYQFHHSTSDVDFLSKIASISAASFCPFIASTSPELFGMSSWDSLAKPRDLEKIFGGSEYIKWNALRESEDSRFVVLTLPRVLARLPYGTHSIPVEAFDFEERSTSNEKTRNIKPEDYCWMNAAYVLGERITNSYSQHRWCTAIRGAEGGGKVNHLPLHLFRSEEGDSEFTCPTEVSITDRREAELSRLGFLPLCHYKNTDYAVFFGAQTLQKPAKFDQSESCANAAISARLPYMMATSRFAHYLKVIARDKIGSFMGIAEVETMLNTWIMNYVNANADSGAEMKAKYPLAEARVQVSATPGSAGAYHAVVWLKPWLQLEELTASLRLVANIPKLA